jgi:hypothetical protein
MAIGMEGQGGYITGRGELHCDGGTGLRCTSK